MVEIRAEARSHDPVFRGRIIRAIEKAFQQAAKKVRNVKRQTGEVIITGHLDYEAFRLDSGEPSVQAAEAAIRGLDLTPQRAVSNGGLDANWLSAPWNSHGQLRLRPRKRPYPRRTALLARISQSLPDRLAFGHGLNFPRTFFLQYRLSNWQRGHFLGMMIRSNILPQRNRMRREGFLHYYHSNRRGRSWLVRY